MNTPHYNESKHDEFNIALPARKIKVKKNIINRSSLKNIKISKARTKANLLFGKMRNLTKEEIKEYRNILNNHFQETGVNFFDIL